MIKCYFVDIKDISSDLPRSNFSESDLEQLANLILATNGLIRPLIIKKVGEENYTVIEGDREYYAALKAKEQNITKAEMVNAFVIGENIQAAAIEQLQLLKEDRSPVVIPASIPSGIEQLLPALSAAISQQIQPLVEQLGKQQKMLEALMLDRIATPIIPTNSIEQPIIPKPIDPPSGIPVIVKVVEPEPPKSIKPPKVSKSKSEKIPKDTASKKVAKLPASIDPIKAANTINLINTLSQNELALAMERSKVSKAAIKLVPSIIAVRDSQPDQKFDTWETIISLKIKSLGEATIKAIIDKLK